MSAYNPTDFHPPAPLALVEVREIATTAVIPNVPMLLDTGADVSLLPRASIASLLQTTTELPQYELESFDGTRSFAPGVNCEVRFLGKSFLGQFLVIERQSGVWYIASQLRTIHFLWWTGYWCWRGDL